MKFSRSNTLLSAGERRDRDDHLLQLVNKYVTPASGRERVVAWERVAALFNAEINGNYTKAQVRKRYQNVVYMRKRKGITLRPHRPTSSSEQKRTIVKLQARSPCSFEEVSVSTFLRLNKHFCRSQQ